jgi:hypothetical protein
MSLTTLRPNATTSNSGSLVGGATAHAVLGDDSDASYVALASSQSVSNGFADFALPAGAAIRRANLRMRVGLAVSGSVVLLVGDGVSSYAGLSINWTAPTTITVLTFEAPTDARLDAFRSDLIRGGDGNTLRVYATYLDVIYVAKPVVAVTAPSLPVDDTNRPRIAWADVLDADGGPQAFYSVRIYDEAVYTARGFDVVGSTANAAASVGVAGDATSWESSNLLPDGTYRAYVYVAQLVNGVRHWSEVAFTEFSVAVDLPAPPSITVSPETTSARHRIDLAQVAGEATTDLFEVEYSYDAGATWTQLRTTEGWEGFLTPVAGRATIWDFEAPNGGEARYRARALHDYSGVYASSNWTEAAGTWSSEQEWMIHPLDPSKSLPVRISEFAPRQRAGRLSTQQPLGSSNVMVARDKRGPETGSFVLQVDEADHIALDELLDATSPLLLVGAAGSSIRHPFYIAVGDTDRVEGTGKGFCDWTLDTINYVRVPRPLGGLLSTPA